MALGSKRVIVKDSTEFFMNVTADPGVVVVLTGAGSGEVFDQSAAYVAVPTGQAPSGTKPIGVLMSKVVDIDLTRQHLNQYNPDEVQKGGKVQICRLGTLVTDKVSGTPVAGAKAYFTSAGLLTTTDPGSCPCVGQCMSTKNADGFAEFDINVLT